MAVTDLSGDLPWWVRQSAPSPTAAPGQSGMGWLNYLSQMFAPNPANMPPADAQNVNMLNSGVGATSEGFPVPGSLNPNSIEARARAIQNPPPPPSVPALPTDAAPPPAQAPAPIPTARDTALGPEGYQGWLANQLANQQTAPASGLLARPATGMGLQPGALSSANLGALNNMPWPSGGGAVGLTLPPPAGQTAPGTPPGPLSASGGAAGVGATSNPRFVPVDRPNMDPLQRGRGGSVPTTTALNLGGLFGGAANPANVPAAAAQPVSAPAGPLANRNVSKAPWTMGPMQRGMGFPSRTPYGPFTPEQIAAASLKQRYG